jgi:dephospho-CoA kinase
MRQEGLRDRGRVAEASGAMRLFILIGPGGAGKSTAASFVDRRRFVVVEAGSAIREQFAAEGLPGETIKTFAQRLVDRHGPDLHAVEIVEMVKSQAGTLEPPGHAVVVGLRTPAQVERLKKSFPHAIVVAIYASPEARFRRLFSRKRADDPTDFIDFLRRDYAELAIGLDRLLSTADQYVVNEGSEVDLQRRMQHLWIAKNIEPAGAVFARNIEPGDRQSH